MAVKTFPPNPYKETIKQAMRDGMSPSECAARFPVSERTCWRYLGELRVTLPGKAPEVKQQRNGAVRITIEADSTDMLKFLSSFRPCPAAPVPVDKGPLA